MPLFDYVCGKCHRRSEILVRGDETPVCPHCGADRLEKQMSAFAAMGAAAAEPACAISGDGVKSCCRRADGSCPNL